MKTSISNVRSAFFVIVSAWAISFLCAAMMPFLRSTQGKDSFWYWPVYVVIVIAIVQIVLLRRDVRLVWLTVSMSVSAMGLGGMSSFLAMGIERGSTAHYGLAVKWLVIGAVFSIPFGLRLRRFCEKGFRSLSIRAALTGVPDQTEKEAVEQSLDRVISRIDEDVEDSSHNIAEMRAIGIALIVIALPMIIFSGVKLGIPWWAFVLGLPVIGYGALMLGRRMGAKIAKKRWGPTEELLEGMEEDLKQMYQRWKVENPEEAAKYEAEHGSPLL